MSDGAGSASLEGLDGLLVHIIRTHGTHILDSGSEPRTQKWTADWASRILRGPAAPDNSSGAKTADGEMSGRPSCVVTSSMRLARRTSLGAPLLLAGRWTHTAPPVRTRALSPAHHTRMYPTRFLKPMCRSHHERARAEAARLALCAPRLGGCPHTRLGGCGCPHSIGRSFRRKTTDTTKAYGSRLYG